MTIQQDLLKFWFGSVRRAGFSATSMQSAMKKWLGMFDNPEERLQFDQEIREKFGMHLEAAAQGKYKSWRNDSDGILAFCILCDQFSRNIHRGKPQAFAMDLQVVEAVKYAFDRQLDKQVHVVERMFLYLPLMHSEQLPDHVLAKEKFEELVAAAANEPEHVQMIGKHTIAALEEHTVLLQQFGRYPHRNKVLGRVNTEEEIVYMASEKYKSFGQ